MGHVQSFLVTYILKFVSLVPVSVLHLGFDAHIFLFLSAIMLKLRECIR